MGTNKIPDSVRLCLLTITLLLILNNTIVNERLLDQSLISVDKVCNFESYHTTHRPIFISSNQDFIDQGWPGIGSEVDPHLIEGLIITSMSLVYYQLYDGTWKSGNHYFKLHVEGGGLYNITLVLFDLYGNRVLDTVFILKETATPATPPGPIDPGPKLEDYLPFIIIMIGFVSLVIFIILKLRRQSMQNTSPFF